jgi:hypothetical protein
MNSMYVRILICSSLYKIYSNFEIFQERDKYTSQNHSFPDSDNYDYFLQIFRNVSEYHAGSVSVQIVVFITGRYYASYVAGQRIPGNTR